MKELSSSSHLPVLAVILLSSSVFADQQQLQIEDFHEISIGTGMIGTIGCGEVNKITIEASRHALERLEVSVMDGELAISRSTSAVHLLKQTFDNNDFEHESVMLNIVTDSPISGLSSSIGTSLKIAPCAIDKSLVEVSAGAGAKINLEGSTGTLELNLATGSQFNNQSSNFTAQLVLVDISTGATANLCGAIKVRGDISTGSSIAVSENTDTDAVEQSFGAGINNNSCK